MKRKTIEESKKKYYFDYLKRNYSRPQAVIHLGILAQLRWFLESKGIKYVDELEHRHIGQFVKYEILDQKNLVQGTCKEFYDFVKGKKKGVDYE